jgi:hypothetical protein
MEALGVQGPTEIQSNKDSIKKSRGGVMGRTLKKSPVPFMHHSKRLLDEPESMTSKHPWLSTIAASKWPDNLHHGTADNDSILNNE